MVRKERWDRRGAPAACSSIRASFEDLISSPRLTELNQSGRSYAVNQAPTATRTFRGHIPGLDALRGVAVLLVIIYHFFMGWPYWGSTVANMAGRVLRSGWVGVDVFFVLSGFLITSGLIDTRDHPHRAKRFYIRRSLRIFPAFYALLILAFFVLPALSSLPGHSLTEKVSSAWPYFFGYISNIWLVGAGDTVPLHLSVTWSLAVEEQFYVLWPLVVWWTPHKHLRKAVVASLFFAFGAKLIALYLSGKVAASYWMFCRVDQFGAGALVSVLLREATFSESMWTGLKRVGWFSLFAGSVVVLFKDKVPGTMFVLLQPILVGLGVAALVMSIIDGGFKRFSKSRVLKFFGKYSYGMYLLHGLFIPWLGPRASEAKILDRDAVVTMTGELLLFLALTVLTSLLLFHLLENPFLNLKSKIAAAK